MRFQRKTQDFSLNDKLVDYLHEYGWTEGDSKKLREFAGMVDVPVKTLLCVINRKLTIGPQLQARLFTSIGDCRFSPRDDLERAALCEWKKNPIPTVIVIARGDRALAQSPQPENQLFFKEQLIRLMSKYEIGKKDGPNINIVSTHAKIHPSALYGLQDKTIIMTVGLKIKLYLSFVDPAFAPLNDNERRQTEVWQEQIPRPLSFVKDAPPALAAKTTAANKEKETPAAPPSPLEKMLLNNATFIKAVAEKVAVIISSAAPQEMTTAIAMPAEIAGNEFISDSFIEETLTILTKAGERLESIMLLANNPRRKIQDELGEKLPHLEDSLRRLFLTVRAISKTATGEAARIILEQETTFISKFKSRGEGGKQ
jgi:hypothetical protein